MYDWVQSEIGILGVAVGLGLLVGLQRERPHSRIAGIRTFSLVTIFGALSGMIAQYYDVAWIIAGSILSIGALLSVANYLKHGTSSPDIGQTTEMAVLVMYAVGVYLVIGDLFTGVAVGAVVALLLYLKSFFKVYVARLGEKDLQAIMVFVAVTLVVLPILPSKSFGPYNVWNLQHIWLMVVLIVGISIIGYFAYKWLGKKVGMGLSGLLGGLISSTATTVSYAKQSKEGQGSHYLPAFVITAASAIAFVRVMIEIVLVAPRSMTTVLPPLVVVAIVIAMIALFLFFRDTQHQDEIKPDPRNPAQFKTAVVFAILYAGVLVLIASVKETFGVQGLYVVSIISGLTDMDAITLSLANMMNNGTIDPNNGWRFILAAALSNLLFKAGIVMLLGNRKVLKIIVLAFSVTLISGILVLLFWPF
ncbi:MAG: MgtC/SapB family protein [Saprospiraceae bacterium]|nr:MgtC/SapB family protein [Saprospiraceae bacterium]